MHRYVIPATVLALLPVCATAEPTVPALAHVESSGAQITAQGLEHGLQAYAARNGDHFMVFDVTPDGQAIVSGVLLQISLKNMLSDAGSRVSELPKVHGLRAFFLRSGDHFQVLYATPDEQRVIPGLMWDAQGHNVTRDQVARIPGTRPTVVVDRASSGPADTDLAGSPDALRLMAQTTAGDAGDPAAPTAWMFIDPQCSFSIRAMQQLSPLVASGKLRLAVIPLSILDREDNGMSTRRALAMVGKPAAGMVAAWESGDLDGAPTAAAPGLLSANMAAASQLQIKGTPTFFWRRPDGTMGRFDGAPPSPAALLAAMGAPA